MNRDKINELMSSTDDDVQFAISLSNEIVVKKTKTLDALMTDIQNNVVNQPNVLDSVIEQYLLELTNAVYFVGSKLESFGFYDDIAKANAHIKYNEAYAQNQLNNANMAKKSTVNDNTIYAEQNSIDENMLSIIYSHSNKIVKGKLDAASEMIRTLSKLLSVHINNKQVNNILDKE